MNNSPITQKQKDVYNYIRDYIISNDYAPTLREMAGHYSTTKSNIHRYLTILDNAGWINKGIAKERGITLTPKMGKPISYLVSPYSYGGESSYEHRLSNYKMACRQAWLLFGMGINIYSPIVHHHNIQAVETMDEMTTADWMQYDLPYLDVAEKIYVLCLEGYEESPGVQAEIAYAKDTGKYIEYLTPTPYVLYGEDISYD